MKKIAIIGSTSYKSRMESLTEVLRNEGSQVRTPAFDDHPEFDELQVCEYNRQMIEWADEIRILWDQRSIGTVFDFGMAFAWRKRIKVVYLEPKTFANVMRQYQDWCEKK